MRSHITANNKIIQHKAYRIEHADAHHHKEHTHNDTPQGAPTPIAEKLSVADEQSHREQYEQHDVRADGHRQQIEFERNGT